MTLATQINPEEVNEAAETIEAVKTVEAIEAVNADIEGKTRHFKYIIPNY